MPAPPKITLDTPIGVDVDLSTEDVRTTSGRRRSDLLRDTLEVYLSSYAG